MSKQRGNGEGTICRRSDERWCAAVTLDGGKRRFYYGRTRQEVQDKLRGAQRLIADGLPVRSDRQTVGQFLKHWLPIAEPTVRPSTFIRYRELTRHVINGVGDVPLRKLTPEHLNGLYAQLGQHLAPRTVGHVHRVLHRALSDGVKWESLHRNVTDAVSPPKVERKEMQVLSPEQARALLDAAEGDALEALYVVAVTAGLREGELLALKWGDLDQDAGQLTVQRTVRYMAGKGAVEGAPKSARSRRSIMLAPLAVNALKRHRARQTEHRLAAIAWDDLDLIFTNKIGRHIEASNLVRRSFRPLLERAGLPAVRFHDLRHTAATLLLLEGVHIKVVSEMLGHSAVSLTLDVYSHVLPTMQADAAAKMEALFSAGRAVV